MKRRPKVKRNCLNCGKEFFTWQQRIDIGKGKFCSTSCGKKGKFNHFWKNGRRKSQGYIKILLPEHPHADLKGYIPEHRLIIEKQLDRYLEPYEVVHHKNHNRSDNRIENLMLLKGQSEHLTEHMKGNKIWLGKKHKPETIAKMKQAWSLRGMQLGETYGE